MCYHRVCAYSGSHVSVRVARVGVIMCTCTRVPYSPAIVRHGTRVHTSSICSLQFPEIHGRVISAYRSGAPPTKEMMTSFCAGETDVAEYERPRSTRPDDRRDS